MSDKQPVKVPALSASMTEGILVSYEMEIGSPVERGDVVATLETDKAVMDIEVFSAGFLSGPLVEVGATVPVGSAIAFVVGSVDEVVGGVLEVVSGPADEPAAGAGGENVEEDGSHAKAQRRKEGLGALLPAAVAGGARGGAPVGRPSSGAASPWARSLAGQLGLDLEAIAGSGPGGVRVGADVAAAALRSPGPAGPPAPLDLPGTERKMTPIEAATARAMTAALTMPTFRVTVHARFDALKRAAKAAGTSTTVAIARACALAMAEHPKVNSAWSGEGLITDREAVDVGIAVAAAGGLVVPVIRDVATRPLADLGADWKDLVGRARNRRLTPTDWEHPTFTVSNMGMLGVQHFDAIPTVGTSAILAISTAREDGLVPLCLTSDHRVVNGADAAAYMNTLRDLLHAPAAWLAPTGPAIPEGDWDYDVVVIGGGPGGEDCARDLSQHGLKVALVNDSPLPGGECLWRGCIPSKVWRAAADRMRDRADDRRLGVGGTETPTLDWAALEAERRSILEERGEMALQTDTALKVHWIQGRGRFTGEHTLAVDPGGNSDDPHARSTDSDGGDAREITFGCAVIATGAPPWVPPIPGAREALEAGAALTSDTIWSLPERPASLVIIGAGAIGAEMAQMFADFGATVTLLEAQDHILAEVEPEVAGLLAAAMAEHDRLSVHTGVRIGSVAGDASAMRVAWVDADGDEHTTDCDRLLLATGKRPVTDSLGLDLSGVLLGDRGAIDVDERCRTSAHHIFAVGDVVGGLMLAHTAVQQGRVAAATILGDDRTYDADLDCGVIFTRPQAAFVGLTLAQAKERGHDAVEIKVPLRLDAQARIHGEEHGVVKLVANKGSRRILGVHLLADHSSALVGEGVAMVSCGLTLDEVAHAIHPHPTTTELYGDLARRLVARLNRAARPRRSKARSRSTA